MQDLYPNPERAWHQNRGTLVVDREQIERRLGPVSDSIIPLSGGLANDTWRIGTDRVLRIYRRDKQALALEKSLLARPWDCFRVPKVLQAGEDFLVLEYVEHWPLRNRGDQGLAAGRAAAEIHRTRYETSGFMDDALTVCRPWSDFLSEMEKYIHSQADHVSEQTQLFADVRDWIAKHRGLLQRECVQPVLLHGDFKASNLHGTHDCQLLVLDWEFAYSGPALMDIGQLCRWGMPEPFRKGFETGYLQNGGRLPPDWEPLARSFDLVNLVGLFSKANNDSQQARDCIRRIRETLESTDLR